MDELARESIVAVQRSPGTASEVLWAIAVVTDAETLSMASIPLNEWMPRVERVRRQEGGHIVLESALPEIRCLAMLLAAARMEWDAPACATRLADAADWLAARIQILALSHVEVMLDQMPVLALANQRLQRFCARSGQVAIRALPILLTGASPREGRIVQRGWSRFPLQPFLQDVAGHGPRVTQALRQRSRERMVQWLKKAGC